MPHDVFAWLAVHRMVAVKGAADGATDIAGQRLYEDVVKQIRLTNRLIHQAVLRHATGHAKVPAPS